MFNTKLIDINALSHFLSNIKEYITNVISAKQDKLVDGNTIKTINGNSILGNGDLIIGNKELIKFTSTSITLSPNKYYRKTDTSSSLTITLDPASDSIYEEYLIEFSTSASGTTIALPNYIKWANGKTPEFKASTYYQISIVNNLGIVTEFA